MTCDLGTLACQLEELTRIVDGQSLTTWVSIGLSAAAALGTLAIAYVNFKLLRRQHALELRMYEDSRRERRAAIASALRDITDEVLFARLQGISWSLQDHRDEFRRVAHLAEKAGLRPAALPTKAVVRLIQHGVLETDNLEQHIALSDQVTELLDLWVDDPVAFAERHPVAKPQ